MVMRTLTKAIIKKILVLLLLIIIVSAVVVWRQKHPADFVSKAQSSPSSSQSGNSSSVSQNSGFDKKHFSVSDPSSIWVVVNKGRVLPSNYSPADLVVPDVKNYYGATANDSKIRKVVAEALQEMFSAASPDSINLILYSGYRSYSQQLSVYSGYVSTQGQAQADTFSARPGHSEHQTGLAVDISAASGKCNVEQCFSDTAEGKWLAANAYKYGFIIRYQKDKQNLTGYDYEPWHIRFVGIGLAAEISKTGQTLEQFFGLPTYSGYPNTSYELKIGT